MVFFLDLDVPVLPVLPLSFNQCKGIDSFCFQLPLPKKHHCSVDLKSQYWFNYTSYSKDYVRKKPIPCDIAVIDKKDTLVCKDSSLNVCKNETLSDYSLHLQIFGRNKLGYTEIVRLSLNPGITGNINCFTFTENFLFFVSTDKMQLSILLLRLLSRNPFF